MLLFATMAYATIYAMYSAWNLPYFGDDQEYAILARNITMGVLSETSNPYTVRALQVYPIVALYELFGYSKFVGSLWNSITFILTVFLAYLLGEELYSKTAGVASALLLSFFPLVVEFTGTMNVDVPLMFFVSLQAFALLKAVRTRRRSWFAASGALLLAPILVNPLGVLSVVFTLVVLAFEYYKKNLKLDSESAFFLYGLFAVFFLVAIKDYALSGNPLNTFVLNGNFYSRIAPPNYSAPGANATPTFYLNVAFPYQSSDAFRLSNTVGLYFYALVLSITYLVLAREKRANYAFLWMGVMFLYLSIGPQNVGLQPPMYLLLIRLGRYLMPIAVPLVATIGVGLASASDRLKGAGWGRAALLLPILVVVVLVLTSVPISQKWFSILSTNNYGLLPSGQYLITYPNTNGLYYFNGITNLVVFTGTGAYGGSSVYPYAGNCTYVSFGFYGLPETGLLC
ncbi:MAG: glycosyltransferase family 39 protein [Candidatus Micrarchaeota archaeon]|nr:glycosyltransferase family 39 protein [Candidatus Micrarchaeota archaeon]